MADNINAQESSSQAKISGYLEKKGKLRMVSSWKKYWFLLDGRLLLYYRSRSEYDTLSPCKGSISLGPSCNLKPAFASSCVFQIETRTNTFTLRAENRYEQDKWMQAILSALNQIPSSNQTKLSHFRYSADDLVRHKHSPTDKLINEEGILPEEITDIVNSKEIINESNEHIENPCVQIDNTLSEIKSTENEKNKQELGRDVSAELKSHIYQEINQEEKNNGETFEQSEKSNEHLNNVATDTIEPSLPPRLEKLTKENNVSEKQITDERIKNLAKIVKENHSKENSKRQSFVARVISKIKRQESSEQLLGIDKKVENNTEDIKHQQDSVKTCNDNEEHPKTEKADEMPELPIKQKYIADYTYDLYNLENRLNIPRPKLIIKSKSSKKEQPSNEISVSEPTLETIDKILDDLNNQDYICKPFSRQKVKDLIEKFNDEPEVTFRNRSKNSIGRHSEDLNFLLEELSKVTNAPVLTPGVTSSLVDTTQHDQEWKILLPERKRRFSEPDYDIPRPHSSLQVLQNVEARKMEPTRFLGPVLLDKNESSCATSLTPDSLELDQNSNVRNFIEEEDRSIRSYTSHIYRLPKNHELDQRDGIYIKRLMLYKPIDKTVSNNNTIRSSASEYQDSLEPF